MEELAEMVTTGDNWFDCEQAITLLRRVRDPNDRSELMAKLVFKLVEIEGMSKLFSVFPKEAQFLLHSASQSVLQFTPGNATGRYSLDLSKTLDRQFFARLLVIWEFQQRQIQSIKSRPGDLRCNETTPRPEFNVIFVQAAKPLKKLVARGIPRQGRVQIDFVDTHTKPTEHEPVIPDRLIDLAFAIGEPTTQGPCWTLWNSPLLRWSRRGAGGRG